MRDVLKRTAAQCVGLLLRPIAMMCIRHSIGFREFSHICKSAFLTVAKDELLNRGLSPSASRLSVMTGLQRRDVAEMVDSTDKIDIEQKASICRRVIGQWLNDRRFHDRNKHPKLLVCEGKKSEFAKLIASVSSDPNHFAVLFELERIGAVDRVGGKVRLVAKAYTPRADTAQGYFLLSEDVSTLITTVEENLLGANEIPNLHAKTSYDNIAPSDVPHIRKWLLEFGRKAHAQVREFLSKYDRDLSQPGKSSKLLEDRVKISFCTFSASDEIGAEGGRSK